MKNYFVSLCCKFLKENVKYKTFNKKTVEQKNVEKIQFVYTNNVNALKQSLVYCVNNNILGFRVTSQLLPFINIIIKEKILSESFLNNIFTSIKNINTHGLILSMHPSQIVNFTSENTRVLNIACEVMSEHFLIANLLNINEINIHVGGTYGNKNKYLEVFINNIKKFFNNSDLSRITIENDEFSYNIDDLFYICDKVPQLRPVFDIHHHNCYSLKSKLNKPSKYLEKIKSYWTKQNYIRIHISSPLIEKYTTPFASRAHNNYILQNECVSCFDFIKHSDKKIIIDVEAKAKEVAIKQFLNCIKLLFDSDNLNK